MRLATFFTQNKNNYELEFSRKAPIQLEESIPPDILRNRLQNKPVSIEVTTF